MFDDQPEDGLLSSHLGVDSLPPTKKLAFAVASVVLVLMAGLMSGLTIGLMAMDEMEMEVLRRSGTATERKYATAIAPLLKNHHYLLCTLVLWNAVSMEALPLFLDKLTNELTAVILSVTVVLIFGEIVPQGVCTRYGLAVGYYASWLVRILMIIAAPVAWPLGKVLDAVLGHSQAALPRTQLREFVTLHGEDEGYARWGEALTRNETHVISSALELTSKTAKTAMTPIDKVFMVASDAIMDEQLAALMIKHGHSRVPVHAPGDRTSIIGQLLVKELLLVKEPTPVGKLKMRSLPALSASMPMWDLLQLFKLGRSHMVVLCEVQSEDVKGAAVRELAKMGFSADLYVGASSFNIGGEHSTASEIVRKQQEQAHSSASYAGGAEMAAETLQDMFVNAKFGTPIGIITIEDVVEELLGEEILDETDRFIDNDKSMKVNAKEQVQDLPIKLQTLLRLGVFTAAVRPGVRTMKSDDTLPLLSGVPDSSGRVSPPLEFVPPSAIGNSTAVTPAGGMVTPGLGGTTPAPSGPASGHLPPRLPKKRNSATVVSAPPEVAAGAVGVTAGEPPTAEEVSAAVQKLEKHLDDPEITSALGTLQEAMSPTPGVALAGASPIVARSGTGSVAVGLNSGSAFGAALGGPAGAAPGSTTPRQRRRNSAIQSSKRSASMQLRDKHIAAAVASDLTAAGMMCAGSDDIGAVARENGGDRAPSPPGLSPPPRPPGGSS